MSRLIALVALALVAGCQTLPAVVVSGGDTFAVRYDAAVHSVAEVDAKANVHCGDGAARIVSQETRFDGFAYRTYRCQREAS